MANTSRSPSATDVLSSYDHASLQQIARKHGIEIKGKSKTALVSAVAGSLYAPDTIRAALDDLEPVERDALNYVILVGGEVLSSGLRDYLVLQGQIDDSTSYVSGTSYRQKRGSPGVRGSRKFEDIVARLGVLGLVFTTTRNTRAKNVELSQPGDTLFIPEAILEHLPAVTLVTETVAQPEVVMAADPATLLRDTYILLSFAWDTPIPLTVRGQIPKRNLVQIAATLQIPEDAAGVRSEADLGRLPFLRGLEEQLRLLIPGAGALRLGEDAGDFLSRPPGVRRKLLFDAYRETHKWSELWRLRGVSAWPKESLTGSGVVEARKRVLTELAALPNEEWIPVDHLITRMQVLAYQFLLSRGRQRSQYDSYYYGSSYYGSSYAPPPYDGNNTLGIVFQPTSDAIEVGWDSVEGEFIRAVVTEALHWLGVVDLGASAPNEPPSAFRITREGGVLLQGGTPLSPMPEPHVVIQPNFQIFAFDPTGEDVLFTLDRIAQRVRAERAIEYHLTRESVYAAQNHGLETADIIAFLDRVSTSPLPQNVRRSLEDWGAQHDRIVIRHTALVHTTDGATLDALYDDPDIRPLLGRRIDGTAALTSPAHLNAIYAHLMTHSSLHRHPIPAVSEGNDSLPHPILTVDPTGRITFRQRLPSIYIRHAVSAFTDDNPDGTLQITQDSLRRAARRDSNRTPLRPEDIITTLQRFHFGPIPEEVVTMIQQWAKDWGQGSLTRSLLLEVQSAEIMTHLLEDEEIAPYIQPIPGSQTVAKVPVEAERHVRSLLRERGMDLNDQVPASKKRR